MRASPLPRQFRYQSCWPQAFVKYLKRAGALQRVQDWAFTGVVMESSSVLGFCEKLAKIFLDPV